MTWHVLAVALGWVEAAGLGDLEGKGDELGEAAAEGLAVGLGAAEGVGEGAADGLGAAEGLGEGVVDGSAVA